ncbi:MAG: ArsR/SmtB family transcription factor [Gemmatimonadota bacterium]
MVEKISLRLVQDAARVLRCIGHPVRLRILEFLDSEGERNVTAIQEALGLEQAVASRHLSLMRDRGILENRREGAQVFYRVRDDRVTKILDCLRGCELPGAAEGR